MLSNNDITKLKKIFTTKEETAESFKEIFKYIGEIKNEIKYDVVHEIREDIIKFKDEILHEIVALREDITVVRGYRDMIEDHDKRLGKLEEICL